MNRFRTKRTLSIRCLEALCLCAFLLIAACDSPKEKEASYVASGKALYDQGDLVKSAIEFKNALQINPTGIDAQYYLGLIAEKQHNNQVAAAAFERVSEQDPNHIEAHRKAGQYSLLGGDVDGAKRHANRLIALEPQKSDGHTLLAAALLASGKVEEAEKEVKTALSLAPESTDAVVIFAGVLARQNKPDEAVAAIEKALEKQPTSVDLLMVKLKLMFDKKQVDDVIAVLRQLHTIDPANPSYTVDLANQLATVGKLDEAEKIFKEAASSANAPDALTGAYANFLVARRSLDDAIKEIKALADQTKESKYVLLLNQLYVRAGKLDEANALMTDLQTNGRDLDDRLRGGVEIARIVALKGDSKKALDQVNAVLQQDGTNDPALLLRGRIMLGNQRFDEAIGDARSVLRRDINSVAALSLLADAYSASGERNLAIDSLRNLVRIAPGNADVRLKLASLLSGSSPDEAMQHIDAAIALRPDAVELQLQKAEFLLRTRAPDKAEVIANSLVKNERFAPGAHRVLGQAALMRSDYPRAIAELTEAQKLGDPFELVAPALVEAYARSGKPGDADTLLNEQLKKHPDDAKTMLLLARLNLAGNKVKEAEDLYRKAIAARPDDTQSYLQLIQLFGSRQSYDQALELADAALAKFPGDRQIATVAAVAADNAGKLDLAKTRYEEVLAKWSDDAISANNLAALIADNWASDRALVDRARKLAERFRNSDNPILLDTLGWVLIRQGNFDDGTVILERAASALPSNQQIQFHYAAALSAKGLKEKAREAFAKALADNPDYRGVAEARQLSSALN